MVKINLQTLLMLPSFRASSIELNMCQSKDYKFKPDELYYFIVNEKCPDCVRIFKENIGEKNGKAG